MIKENKSEKLLVSTRDEHGRIEDPELAHEMALAGNESRRKAMLAKKVGEALCRDLLRGKIKGAKIESPSFFEDIVSNRRFVTGKEGLDFYPFPGFLAKKFSGPERLNMRAQIKHEAGAIARDDNRIERHGGFGVGAGGGDHGKATTEDYRAAAAKKADEYLRKANYAENEVEDKAMENTQS